MNPDDWQKAKELLADALQRPPAARADFVNRACGDPELRRELLELLENADDAADAEHAGESLVVDWGEAVAAAPAPDVAMPQVVGSYVVLRKIAEGGMGVVYEAEQQHPRRTVALKVIRGGAFVSDLAVKLFEREAQALARLKHPGIAAIYEAGRTEAGQHYFAMELVGGVQLLDFSRALSGSPGSVLRRRLEVFCRICDAVAYAHQRGVIHRDLKPSNVMVVPSAGTASNDTAARAAAEVKVLDFGLARINDADVSMVSHLSPGVVAGTLAYMSPEQARGQSDEIDVRSDVYSLGAMLYELVTGAVPYDVRDKSLPEALRIVCEEPPRRPTRLFVTPAADGGDADGGRSTPRLDDDLVTIVLKALDKDPARRYQSASAFGDDVERYLRGEPVLARPATAVYQLRKLVSRHRAVFAVAASVLALIVAFAVIMSVQSARTARERDRALAAESRARTEAESARRTSEFLIDIFEVSNPSVSKGNTITAREILDRAAADVEHLANDPVVHAALTETIGRVYHNLGLLEESRRFFESSLAKRRQAFGADHLLVANSLTNLGEVLTDTGNYDAARPLLQEAVSIRQSRPATSSSELADEAYTLESLGQLLYLTSDFEGADVMLREALATRRRAHDGDDPAVAGSLSRLAQTQTRRRNFAEAEQLFVEAMEMDRRLGRSDQTDFAVSLGNLAEVYRERGEIDQSVQLLREALALWQKLVGDSHPEVTKNLNNLAMLLQSRGQYVEAEVLLRRVAQLGQEQYGATHPNAAIMLRNLANLLTDAGRASEAEPLYAQVLAIQRKTFTDDHPEVAYTLARSARCDALLGRYAIAEPRLVASYGVLKSKLGREHRYTTIALRALVELYDAWKRPREAAEYRALLPASRTAP